ncbi:MAG TPA: endolytic transglycosylase MltG [Povalibacter sp.]|uniref:endolytic transglycosylase MltG n=1 Tax=Povalibacter sp. TaxID=1962978 RepID=UPI002B7C47A8|nr:endolytic transglycosylase MltG [Povalibacter sp.]HMN43306.1 endolytic transglycosylase MltG [Povalibacter sp.]
MRSLLRIVMALIVVAAAAAALIAWRTHVWLQTPIAGLHETATFEVEKGASLRTVAMQLNQRGWLDQPDVWIVWARLTQRQGGLKAGEYALAPGATPRSLLDTLSSGQVILHGVTFIEGARFADIRKLMTADESIAQTLSGKDSAEVMRSLGADGIHPEGQFFPDTYRFPRGTSDLDLLRMAYRRMQGELEAAWESRAADLPLATKYEALILASIIEKETALDSERAKIGGVFIERLKRGMRLQTDPTVIYGIENYDGNIRRVDLLRDTPYNTYTRSGLPPTPIALPGSRSLQAAVRPEMTGALFFVATGKGDGSHYFSATLAEHNAAVQRYLRQLRQQQTAK